MLHLPQILNQHGLFQRLNGLKKESHKFGDLKEAILNHGTDAILRMERIRHLNAVVLKEFELFADQAVLKGEKRVVFAAQSMGALLGEISPLFSTLRVLQNRVLALTSAWESVQLPKSMNDFSKKADKYSVSRDVKDAIASYWERSGKHVKFYRDIDQHDFNRAELTSRYFIDLLPEPRVLAELPDYQSVLRPSEFSYANQINAFEFLDDACFELHKLIEEIAELYGAEEVPHSDSVRMDQLGDLIPWRSRTLAIMYEQSLETTENGRQMNLSAIRIDQNTEGKLVLQKMLLDGKQLEAAKKLYGVQ